VVVIVRLVTVCRDEGRAIEEEECEQSLQCGTVKDRVDQAPRKICAITRPQDATSMHREVGTNLEEQRTLMRVGLQQELYYVKQTYDCGECIL
jgi:hypothetical protein